MKIKIKMIKLRIHQIKSPLLAASRSSLRFSTPSGHHLQARKVGRRIRKAMRPDTAVPPFLDLGLECGTEFQTGSWKINLYLQSTCVSFWQPKMFLESVKKAFGKPQSHLERP